MFEEISIFVGSQRVSTAIQWLGPAGECLAITAEVFLKAGKWKLMSSDLIQMPWAAEGGPQQQNGHRIVQNCMVCNLQRNEKHHKPWMITSFSFSFFLQFLFYDMTRLRPIRVLQINHLIQMWHCILFFPSTATSAQSQVCLPPDMRVISVSVYLRSYVLQVARL